MKIGDIIDMAIWIDGRETEEERKQFEEDVKLGISWTCAQEGFEPGEVKFEEKHPDDSDVPPVPDHIKGERVRLLYASARVESKLVLSSKGSFLADLEKKDLELLRNVTRRAIHPNVLHEKDIDAIIEELGPEAAMDAVRKHHRKSLH